MLNIMPQGPAMPCNTLGIIQLVKLNFVAMLGN